MTIIRTVSTNNENGMRPIKNVKSVFVVDHLDAFRYYQDDVLTLFLNKSVIYIYYNDSRFTCCKLNLKLVGTYLDRLNIQKKKKNKMNSLCETVVVTFLVAITNAEQTK